MYHFKLENNTAEKQQFQLLSETPFPAFPETGGNYSYRTVEQRPGVFYRASVQVSYSVPDPHNYIVTGQMYPMGEFYYCRAEAVGGPVGRFIPAYSQDSAYYSDANPVFTLEQITASGDIMGEHLQSRAISVIGTQSIQLDLLGAGTVDFEHTVTGTAQNPIAAPVSVAASGMSARQAFGQLKSAPIPVQVERLVIKATRVEQLSEPITIVKARINGQVSTRKYMPSVDFSPMQRQMILEVPLSFDINHETEVHFGITAGTEADIYLIPKKLF
jgi:hypothetical protein